MRGRYGYCPHCDQRRELVMTEADVLACWACDAVDVYDSREAYHRYLGEHPDGLGEAG